MNFYSLHYYSWYEKKKKTDFVRETNVRFDRQTRPSIMSRVRVDDKTTYRFMGGGTLTIFSLFFRAYYCRRVDRRRETDVGRNY